METLVGVKRNSEGNFKESEIEKSNSTFSSPNLTADQVVYKLVRVDGDGKLVPATDDELMEVGNLLADDKIEMHIVADSGLTGRCILNERSSSGMPNLESSEGLSKSENAEVDAGKLNTHLESIEEMLKKAKQEESDLLACGSPDHSSAYVLIDGQCSDRHDSLPGIDEKLQSEIALQELDLSSAQSSIKSPNSPPGNLGECSNSSNGIVEGQQSTSAVCTSSKPDFSRLKGEICLDNLSIKELQETFKATFGRETTVKDKQWLKRRIAMGLTNSCDVSTSSFIIKDYKLVGRGGDRSLSNEATRPIKDPAVKFVNGGETDSSLKHSGKTDDQQIVSGQKLSNFSTVFSCGNEDPQKENRTTKRIRKPTRRYIEELSEVESKEYGGKPIISAESFGLGHMSSRSNTRPVGIPSSNRITVRLESLGGSGVQVPYVFRVRRSRPRKNVKAFMTQEFHSYGIGVTSKLVQPALDVNSSEPNSVRGNIGPKASSIPEQIQQQFVAEPEKDKEFSEVAVIERRQIMEPNHIDRAGDTSDDSAATVPTVKGGVRRKHHRAWTLSEVMKLVEGVSRYGAGRWSEIKRLAFASYSYRTSVDLKDKWRNLLKASVAPTPPDTQTGSRKHASSVPIPVPILLRVRELAEMQSLVPPNLSSRKLAMAGCGRGNVNEARSGGNVNEAGSGYL